VSVSYHPILFGLPAEMLLVKEFLLVSSTMKN